MVVQSFYIKNLKYLTKKGLFLMFLILLILIEIVSHTKEKYILTGGKVINSLNN